jgi:hypothetical protein
MTRTALALVLTGIGAALAAACSSNLTLPLDLGGDSGGTCPCTVGNSGLSFTIPCGGSECLDLNGTATGYTCDETGTHVNQAVCNSPPHDAGPRSDATTRHEGGLADAGAPDAHPPSDAGGDRVVLLDGEVCVPTSAGGSCNDAGCSCAPAEGCSFACADVGPDAGVLLECNPAETCSATCGGTCAVDCEQSSGCTVEAGAWSKVSCEQSESCSASVGVDGSVYCSQAEVCSATVAPGGSVYCLQAGTCNVTCTGSCSVDCSQAQDCRVHCADPSGCNVDCAATTEIMCPDNTIVCGLDSPTCAPPDAGPG